jgi:hypothetical protein
MKSKRSRVGTRHGGRITVVSDNDDIFVYHPILIEDPQYTCDDPGYPLDGGGFAKSGLLP